MKIINVDLYPKPRRKSLAELLHPNIELKTCPRCKSSGRIEIDISQFGRTGVRVVCTHCNTTTPKFSISEMFFIRHGIYTPVTKRKLIKATAEAIKTWNAR